MFRNGSGRKGNANFLFSVRKLLPRWRPIRRDSRVPGSPASVLQVPWYRARRAPDEPPTARFIDDRYVRFQLFCRMQCVMADDQVFQMDRCGKVCRSASSENHIEYKRFTFLFHGASVFSECRVCRSKQDAACRAAGNAEVDDDAGNVNKCCNKRCRRGCRIEI